MEKPAAVHEFLVKEVFENQTGRLQAMVVKEYKKIGEGAFGSVYQAQLRRYIDNNYDPKDTWLGPFAIKKVPLQTEYKSRELELLRVTSHPNIVQLKYFYNYPNAKDGKIYQHLVMELLPSTLQNEIKRCKDHRVVLPIKNYSLQLANGLLYLHHYSIAHRDLKPSNILIDPSTQSLKICDFGSAKKLDPNAVSVAYICSRYYRAPELIVGCQTYTTSIDIWGFGCILGEMIILRPIFQGKDPYDQLREIIKLLGPFSSEFMKTFVANELIPQVIKFSSVRKTRSFAKLFGAINDDDAINLLRAVLRFEPEKRLTALEILKDKFYAQYRG